MTRGATSGLAILAVLFGASVARADRRASTPPPPPPIEARLSPWQQSGEPIGDARYFYVLEVAAVGDPNADVVADRRLLSFEFDDTSRRHRTVRCTHPNAPTPRRAMQSAQKLTVHGASAPYREWIDIRSYCFGSALEALERGAHVRANYGYARGGRNDWVARAGDNRVRSVVAGEFEFAAVIHPPTTGDAVVRLQNLDRATAGGMSFSVSVRSAHGRRRVYVRPDLFRFRVRGPLGSHECGVPMQPIVPIADFFSTVSERASAGRTLDVERYCPDAFAVEGVYEVTPVAELPYTPRSARNTTDVLTGTFEGAPALVRIRTGERGYVDQSPGDDRARVVHGGGEP